MLVFYYKIKKIGYIKQSWHYVPLPNHRVHVDGNVMHVSPVASNPAQKTTLRWFHCDPRRTGNVKIVAHFADFDPY